MTARTFTSACPGQEFSSGTVAGGAGINAKQVLNARLAQNDPPDVFQVHAGAELLDHIDAGQIRDLLRQGAPHLRSEQHPVGSLAEERMTAVG